MSVGCRITLLVNAFFLAGLASGCLTPEAMDQINACTNARTPMEHAACNEAVRRNAEAANARRASDRKTAERELQRQGAAAFEAERIQGRTPAEAKAEMAAKRAYEAEERARYDAQIKKEATRMRAIDQERGQLKKLIMQTSASGGSDQQPADLTWLNDCWLSPDEILHNETVRVYAVLDAQTIGYAQGSTAYKFDGQYMNVDFKFNEQLQFVKTGDTLHMKRRGFKRGTIRRSGEDKFEFRQGAVVEDWHRCP